MKHVTPERYALGLDAEKRFADKHLYDVTWASKDEDIFEHWDVKGKLHCLQNEHEFKFDVKAIKNVTIDQNKDECTWIEGTNVMGDKGWIKGEADYIVFERQHSWLVVNRPALHDFIFDKLEKNNYKLGKGLYMIYTREGKKDKITLVPFNDIKQINHYELTK